jgi:chemotaxis protein methyltransferase CheR
MDELLLPLTDGDFRFVSALVYDTFGIRLTEQKRSLIAGRLSKRVRQLGYSSFHDYFAKLRDDRSGAELSELINRVTTNHSFFFRERDHFDVLAQDILPGLADACVGRVGASIRIWSAGCAAGEEPYTLAMILRDVLSKRPGGGSVDASILATDVSMDALLEAKSGVYAEARLKELPKAYRSAFLQPAGPDAWAVTDDIKAMVLFKRLNLMTEPYPFKSKFDVVFCRNVMIYFDVPSRATLVRSIHRVVKPGGWFFIGHSESLPRDTCPFSYVRPATYRKETA